MSVRTLAAFKRGSRARYLRARARKGCSPAMTTGVLNSWGFVSGKIAARTDPAVHLPFAIRLAIDDRYAVAFTPSTHDTKQHPLN